jgi:hypothetical protein
MVLETIRQGGWSKRAITQQRPRISKPELKGLSNYYSNKIAVEAARWGASGPKRATLTKYLLKKRELDNSSKPNLTRAKQPAREKYH